MKKIVSFILMGFVLIPALVLLAACDHVHSWALIYQYGYDQSGAYCRYIVCDECGAKGEKEVIVEAVKQDSAALKGTGVESLTGDSKSNFSLDMTFAELAQASNQRCESGKNVDFVKTKIGAKTVPGLPISGNIKLTEDINIGYNGNTSMCLHITDEVTIDLNGHTITQQCGTDGMSGYALFIVREGGTLNIIDSSKSKSGKIDAVMSAIQINAGGVVNLYSGTIQCGQTMTRADVSEQYFCVWTIATNGGTFNQYGGLVTTVETRNIRGGGTYTATDYNYAFATYGTGCYNLYAGSVVGDIDEAATELINDQR